MAIVDLLIVAFVLFFAVRGLLRGLVVETVGLLGIILAFLCSFMLHASMLKIVYSIGLKGSVASVAAYVAGFFLVYVLVVIAGKFLHRALSAIYLGWANRTAGFVFGLFKGAVIASLILWGLFYVVPRNSDLMKEVRGSSVAVFTMKVAPNVYGAINSWAGGKGFDLFGR